MRWLKNIIRRTRDTFGSKKSASVAVLLAAAILFPTVPSSVIIDVVSLISAEGIIDGGQ